jgi:hypothetical protein
VKAAEQPPGNAIATKDTNLQRILPVITETLIPSRMNPESMSSKSKSSALKNRTTNYNNDFLRQNAEGDNL